MLCQLFTAFNIIVTGRLCSVLFKNIAIIDVTYIGLLVFTARCYASAVLAMALCPSVSLSVRPSVTSRCSTKTAKLRITQQHHTIAQGL